MLKESNSGGDGKHGEVVCVEEYSEVKHGNPFFQFPISFEESKELGMEVNQTEVLKDTLVIGFMVRIWGKKKKKELVFVTPSKVGEMSGQ